MIVLNPFTHDARVVKEARTLIGHGHQVTVNALWEPGLPMEERVQGIQVKRVRLRSRQRMYVPLAAWAELLPRFIFSVRNQKPDVIHAHDLNALIPGFFISRLTKARLIYDAHEFEIGRTTERSSSTSFRRWVWQSIEGILIHRVQASITVSASISTLLSRMYHVKAPTILRNCPELIELPPAGRLRQELGIAPDQPMILFQGVLSKGRGLENALRAVAPIPTAFIVYIGDGPLRNSLESLSNDLNMHNRVSFIGKLPIDILLNYTRDASIGLCLTENTCLNHYYSLPNKLFEYFMVGVPVLASNFPDLSAVVQSSGAGLVTDPSDIQGISHVIISLISDPQSLFQMSKNARLAAETKYNWSIEELTLLDIYNHIDIKG